MPSPRAIVTLLILLVIAALIGGGVWQQSRIDAAQNATRSAQDRVRAVEGERDTAREETRLARENVRVVTKYVDRVETVYVAGKTITKEIPVYVTPEADAACTVPLGFVRIHDAAAANTAPEPAAGDPDAPAAGLALSAIAETVTDNYTQYHALGEQLTALQDYVRTSCPAAQAAP
jgi:cytochrome oxidase assembly protein ShyY1